MTSFFPDINVWLALTVSGHVHASEAWKWLNALPKEAQVVFSRITQLGLLRLLMTEAAMGAKVLSSDDAWAVFERWTEDPRVALRAEPRGIDPTFRRATRSFGRKAAPKALMDAYLLAFALESQATMVTFDRALVQLAAAQHCPAIRPS